MASVHAEDVVAALDVERRERQAHAFLGVGRDGPCAFAPGRVRLLTRGLRPDRPGRRAREVDDAHAVLVPAESAGIARRTVAPNPLINVMGRHAHGRGREAHGLDRADHGLVVAV